MAKTILLVFILFSLLPVFFGCAPKAVKTELDQLFENDFEGLNVPAVTKIKEDGINKDFPYATFDEVWDSVITVLMQQRIIVRGSKETGTIVTVTGTPLVIFVEQAETVTVHVDCMCNLFKQADDPKAVIPKATLDFKEKTAKFFDKVSTQVYADEKWKYLFKTEK